MGTLEHIGLRRFLYGYLNAKVMESEKFCLRWNDFETNISAGFRELRNEKDFFDVTLACDDTFKQTNRPRIATATVPPKRIRIDPPPTPVPARNYQQELDIEEVVHVKSEPRETQSQSIINFQQQQQQHDDLVPEEDHGQGTVAVDESYSVNDGYEYQYEEAYEDGTVGIVGDKEGDLEVAQSQQLPGRRRSCPTS